MSDRDEILARLQALLKTASALDDPTLLPEMQGLVQDAQRAQTAQTTTGGEVTWYSPCHRVSPTPASRFSVPPSPKSAQGLPVAASRAMRRASLVAV